MSSYRSVVWECTYLSTYVVTYLSLSFKYSSIIYPSFQQLWTVALLLIKQMVMLVKVMEQLLDIQSPTAVIQGTTWWEAVLAHVKLQEGGLEVHLHVNV